MKRYLPYIIGAIVLLGGAGAYFIVQAQNNTTKQTDDSSASTEDVASTTKKYSDACKLFSKAEIGAALGGTYSDGEDEYVPSTVSPGSPNYEELRGSACNFTEENDGSTTAMTEAITLSVAINNHESTASATDWMNSLHSPQTVEGQEAMDAPVDVNGVGDQAFFAKVKVAGGAEDKSEALYVRIGKQVIVLTVTRLAGVDHSAVQEDLTGLAKKL